MNALFFGYVRCGEHIARRDDKLEKKMFHSASVCFFSMTCWTLAYDEKWLKMKWNTQTQMRTGHGFRAR